MTKTRKLSFKDKHALETLPARMEALQGEIGRLRAGLADADLYRCDPAAFARLTGSLQAAEAELRAAE